MVQCPLKLILFGEHAVLKGGMCLSLCLKKYSRILEIKKSNYVKIIDNRNDSYYISVKNETPLILKDEPNDFSIIKIDSYFGCGLGTSASISLLLAYLNNLKHNDTNEVAPFIDKDVILQQALKYEEFYHWKSSGADVFSCFTGGLISFKDGQVEKLNPASLEKYKILLFDSKISKKTCNIIQLKKINEEKNTEKLATISIKAFDLIKNGFDLIKMYEVLRAAQDALEDLGLVPDSIKNEVQRLRNMGIESKLSGAGCGGYLFTFVPKEIEIDGWFDVEIEMCGFEFYIN